MHNRRFFFVIVLFVLTNCYQTSLAGRIVWDEGHTPLNNYELNGEYSTLRDQLRQDGFELEVNEDEIGINSLWDADILVISVS